MSGIERLLESAAGGGYPIARKPQAVVFEYSGRPGQQVTLAGTFNHWRPEIRLEENSAGWYACTLQLEPGAYEYKFVVDGRWMTDPESHWFVVNEHGSLNSVLLVK